MRNARLTSEDYDRLQTVLACCTSAQRDVIRARIALMIHDGFNNKVIAERVGVSVQAVGMWRRRLTEEGIEGLDERQRQGRPRRIIDAQRLEVVALACETWEEDGRVTPTLDEVRERALSRGVVDHISRSHLHRILQAGDIRPHRVQQWLHIVTCIYPLRSAFDCGKPEINATDIRHKEVGQQNLEASRPAPGDMLNPQDFHHAPAHPVRDDVVGVDD